MIQTRIWSEFDYLIDVRKKINTQEFILSAAAEAAGVTVSQMFEKNPTSKRGDLRRDAPLVLARQLAYKYFTEDMHYSLIDNGYSLERAGNIFRQDHATVLHAVRKINNLLEIGDQTVIKAYNLFKDLTK